MRLHDGVEYSLSSEMKFNLVYIPVIYQLHQLALTHLTSLALASSCVKGGLIIILTW